MIVCEEDVVPKGGRPPFIPPGLPRPTTASRSFWLLPVLSLTGYQKFISLGQN